MEMSHLEGLTEDRIRSRVKRVKNFLHYGRQPQKRFIRTLKENLLWVRAFDTIEELQVALQKFKDDYNEQWLIQRHGHRSPNQFRRNKMDKMPAAA